MSSASIADVDKREIARLEKVLAKREERVVQAKYKLELTKTRAKGR